MVFQAASKVFLRATKIRTFFVKQILEFQEKVSLRVRVGIEIKFSEKSVRGSLFTKIYCPLGLGFRFFILPFSLERKLGKSSWRNWSGAIVLLTGVFLCFCVNIALLDYFGYPAIHAAYQLRWLLKPNPRASVYEVESHFMFRRLNAFLSKFTTKYNKGIDLLS